MVTSASPRGRAGGRARRAWVALPLIVSVVGACSSGDGADAAGDGGGPGEGSGDAITLGFSAWPGWFPWAVADQAGIFEEVGVDVEVEFFNDYIGSLDAMASGQLDANSQTLNDTLVGVSAGSDQVVVVVNDNSSGNDAIIVDESIETIEDLEGATIAAEPGVVDHFLLLQGLDSVGLTEEDVDFQGMLTDQAAATFAGGRLDGVGVFAPFTLEALEREGSHVLFDSSDFPGTIPDFLVVDRQLVDERPEDVQLLVDAWYATLDYIEENPEESTEIMAEQAGVSAEEYESFAEGTRVFTAEEALASMTGDGEEDLVPMAEEVTAFLAETELLEDEPGLDGLYDPSFTEAYLESAGG